MKKYKYTIRRTYPVIFVLVFLALFLCTSTTEAIGVRPLVINLEMEPGETKEFEITLTPSDRDELVNLKLYQLVQQHTGGLSYQETGSESFPVVDWIQLEDRVELPVGEDKIVRGTVTVPFNAEGTNTVVVMVEPEVEEAEQGITFKVRYAIRLNINIDRPGIRPRGELADFEFLTENQNSPVININFNNISKLYYEVTAEATIRNEQGRLIERIPISAPVSWQSGRDSITIYPGAQVLFTGNVTEPLYPGKYQLRLFFRYANGLQLIERRELEVEESFGIEKNIKPVRVSPESINLELRPGAAKSQLIEVENLSNEEIYLAVTGREIERDYANSIYNVIEIQLRGEEEMLLEPYEKKRMVATFRAPRDLEPGGYYGYLDFLQRLPEEKSERYSIVLEVLSGKGDLQKEAEILSLYFNPEKDESIYSIEVENKGKSHLIPEGQLTLKDKEGKLIKVIELKLQEGIEKILPGKAELMVAIEEELLAGTYIAEVSISEAGQNIARKHFEIINE